jgi:hypothetical protein
MTHPVGHRVREPENALEVVGALPDEGVLVSTSWESKTEERSMGCHMVGRPNDSTQETAKAKEGGWGKGI